MLANDPLPAQVTRNFGTEEDNQESVILRIMENTEKDRRVEQDRYSDDNEIGNASLELPGHLPANSRIEVTFELTREGRLHVVGREPISGAKIEATIETKGGISEENLQEAKSRATTLTVS